MFFVFMSPRFRSVVFNFSNWTSGYNTKFNTDIQNFTSSSSLQRKTRRCVNQSDVEYPQFHFTAIKIYYTNVEIVNYNKFLITSKMISLDQIQMRYLRILCFSFCVVCNSCRTKSILIFSFLLFSFLKEIFQQQNEIIK
jgi:hypothetical protein